MFFRCPIIYGFLAFGSGVLCADGVLTIRPAADVSAFIAPVLLLTALASAAAAVRLQGRPGNVMAALFLFLSAAAGFVQGGRVQNPLCAVPVQSAWFTGRVFGRPSVSSLDTVLLVDLACNGSRSQEKSGASRSCRTRLSYPTPPSIPGSAPPPPADGQQITFFTTLRRPAAFGNPGGFDYIRYLDARGVRFTARLKSGMLINRKTPPPRDPAAAACRWAERTTAARYACGGTDGLRPPGALLLACLIGEKRWVHPRDEDLLRRSGLGHLLAISGLHLGLLGLVITRFLAWIRSPIRVRRLALMVFFVAYHELCGPKPSITRAVITAVIFLTGGSLGVHPNPLNSLSAAGLAILAINPLMLFDAGFQLSFGATFSILLLGPLFIRQQRSPRWVFSVSCLFGVSAAVLLGIAPLQASLFHRATPAVLLTNAAAGPLLGLSLASGLVFLASQALCAWTPPCCALLLQTVAGSSADLVDFGFGAILWLARHSAGLSFRLPGPTLAVLSAYYLCLGVAALIYRGPRTAPKGRAVVLLVAAAPSILLVGALTGGRRLPDGCVRVTILDVGQGDSTIIECPGRHTLVIDGGGALPWSGFDFGEMAVSPAMWDLGLLRVDEVAVSHGHQDHAGGLPSVVRNFRPRRILAGSRLSMRLSAVRALSRAGEECRAPVVRLHRGMVLRRGEVELVVLHPPPPVPIRSLPTSGIEQDAGPNNNSLVLLLRHRHIRMLFTGDLENEGEEVLLRSPLSGLIAGCQLIKVGHHGAPGASSAGWIKLVSPKTAVITAGRFNRFGHPDPSLHHKLGLAGCRRIHCTGRDGALVVVSDGRRLYHRTGPF